MCATIEKPTSLIAGQKVTFLFLLFYAFYVLFIFAPTLLNNGNVYTLVLVTGNFFSIK
jgi:hypothetical protein